MRLTLAIVAASTLGGCAMTDKLLTNRIAVTLSMDECRVDSRWFGPGISTAIAAADCEVILAAARLRALGQAIELQRATGARRD